MASPEPLLHEDRALLEHRLCTDLREQQRLHRWPDAPQVSLLSIESHIQDTARRLEPDAPQSAIVAARQRLAVDDLSVELAHRSWLPDSPALEPEPRRELQRVERQILDLAREAVPGDPGKAIARATPAAHRLLTRMRRTDRFLGDPTDQMDEGIAALESVSRRLRRHATYPEPTAQQRVHQVLGDLRRLDVLGLENRRVSEARHRLPFRGNVSELRNSLGQIKEPRDLLTQSSAEIYRHPDVAESALQDGVRRSGLQATIDRFAENPAAFGEVRGLRIPLFGDSPERSRALDLVRQSSVEASTALVRREGMENALEAAVSFQRIQSKNRDLVDTYPSREQLLTELGRHMESLEIHQVRPLLRPGQAELVQDVRRAEQYFLEPLREASRSFRALDAGGGARFGVQAQKIAGLFQGAPRHIVSRLTPPQMQAVLVAVSIAKHAKKFVARVASV